MSWIIARYFLSLGNVALSLVVAVGALAYCAVFQRPFLLGLFKSAEQIRTNLVSFSGWPDGEIIARLVLHDSTIVLMFFTLAARAVLGLIVILFGLLFNRQGY
jgi:hypothetical protein